MACPLADKWYCVLAISTVFTSSLISVVGSLLPATYVARGARLLPPRTPCCLTRPVGRCWVAVASCCNAANTIGLGVLALLHYEAKASMHFSAAQSLQALRIKQLELRDKFEHLVRGYKHSLSADGLDTFWRSWSLSVESINAKSQEVRPALAETCHRALGGLPPPA